MTEHSRRADPASAMPGLVTPGRVDAPTYERPLPTRPLGGAAILAAVLFVALLTTWELAWRRHEAVPGPRNSNEWWAQERRRIDEGEGDATVLVGDSRTLSDVQLPVWARLSGKAPIQLAMEGTSAIYAMEDLAADTAFKGRLVVGLAPGLFFTGFGYRADAVTGWRKVSLSNRWGQQLSQALLEPWLAYYDPDFALFTQLERQPWPQRAAKPFHLSPPKIFVHSEGRNTRMWQRVIDDTVYRDIVRRVWMDRPPPPDSVKHRETIEKQIERAVRATEQLRARGVEVTFVVHPAAGDFWQAESHGFPRAITWDALLRRTGARGIHWEDHPSLQGYEIPEWSHMTGPSADRYTEALYRIWADSLPRGTR